MSRKLVKGTAAVVLAVVLFGVVKGILGFLHIKRDLDLVAAASSGRTAEVKALLARGASPNATHIEGSSALWWAVVSGSYPTVKVLLDSGANPNSTGQYNSVISQALNQLAQAEGTPQEKTYKAIVKELIAKGAVVPKGAKLPTTAEQGAAPDRLQLRLCAAFVPHCAPSLRFRRRVSLVVITLISVRLSRFVGARHGVY